MSTNAQLEAHEPDKSLQREAVYEEIARAHPWGIINDGLAARLQLVQGVISARITELRDAGRVKDGGRERWGARGARQAVWILGDDSHVVHADRVRKLHKLAAKLGYTVTKNDDAE